MRSSSNLLIFGILGIVLWGCGGGGSGGETQQFFALTNSPEIVVGGIKGSVGGGAIVQVRNLSNGQERQTTSSGDGSFVITLEGSIGDTIGISAPGVDTAVEVMSVSDVSSKIKQEIMSGAVRRNLAAIEGFPTAIEIRGDRAYVLNFFNRIEIFNLDQDPPQRIGEIVLPPESDPVSIAFLDDTFAYVVNNIGQSIALVNVETMQCELLIVRSDSVPPATSICQNQVITVDPEFFEDPSAIAIAPNGKVYVTNNNLDDFFEPIGNGFITVISSETNQVINRIDATRANSDGITIIDNRLYVVNTGDTDFDLVTEENSCDFDFPPSIDVIDTQSDTRITINISLSTQNPNVCSPNRIEPTPDGKFGYMGLGLVGALLKVDLENNSIINGPSDPIIITPLDEFNFTADIKIRNDGLGFITLFNTDQIAVFDTATDEINPFPFIAFFPAGFGAENPDSEFFEGVQSLAIRPGIPGIDFQGADIFYITSVGQSTHLGSINTGPLTPE
ncbi:MAG TPA: hypothetical protein VI935_01885 [Thermodesulfobacteriota bacterium]|nr:hypothetical protein [Thermodesulfobacteriota bacterium]